ncbi:hypothetical protein C1X05_10590 [Laceyella sacchari]|nr:hypothetical protein C1X05_10590 [Laceyella sacchari]
MNTFTIIRTEMLRQIRSYPFMITLALIIFMGYALVPTSDAGYTILHTGGVRGIYNSAWLSAMATVASATLLWLFGFYLLRSNISTDRQLNIGTLIVPSPYRNGQYLFTKALSNWLLLLMMHLALIFAFMVMQLVRRESVIINVWDYFAPFLFVIVPSFAVLAALTILFDVIPGLKGALGNFIYFFLWAALGAFSLEKYTWADVMGVQFIFSAIIADAKQHVPLADESFGFGYNEIGKLQTFVWDGITWTPDIIQSRLTWFIWAIGLFAVALLIFRRNSLLNRHAPAESKPGNPAVKPLLQQELTPGTMALSPLQGEKRYELIPHIRVELKLISKDFPRWWYIVTLLLIAGSLFLPYNELKDWMGLLLVWPIALWSQMATREKRYRMTALVTSSGPPLLQTLSIWIAGLLATFALGIGVTLNTIMAGDWDFLLSWVVGMCFVPTLALLSGVISGPKKVFEVIYLLLWYMGPMQYESALDFYGLHLTSKLTWFYFLCTVVLLATALFLKKKQANA